MFLLWQPRFWSKALSRSLPNPIWVIYRAGKRLAPETFFTGDILINDTLGVVYIAIPKCANSSLKSAFIENLYRCHVMESKVRSSSRAKKYSPLVEQQIRTALVKNNCLVHRNDVLRRAADYTRFAVVRDPVDRLISCWRDKIAQRPITDWRLKKGVHRGFDSFGNLFWAGMSFEEFVHSVSRIPNCRANPHFRSQASFLRDHRKRYLPSVIVRQERLRDALQEIPVLEEAFRGLPWKNQSSNQADIKSRISVDTLELLQRRYRRDYELLRGVAEP